MKVRDEWIWESDRKQALGDAWVVLGYGLVALVGGLVTAFAFDFAPCLLVAAGGLIATIIGLLKRAKIGGS